MFLSCHYVFQSESTIYSCLNINELLAQSRCEILSLSDCNWTRTHSHLNHKRTLTHLASWVFIYELSGCGFESSCSQLIINKVVVTKYFSGVVFLYENFPYWSKFWKTEIEACRLNLSCRYQKPSCRYHNHVYINKEKGQ